MPIRMARCALVRLPPEEEPVPAAAPTPCAGNSIRTSSTNPASARRIPFKRNTRSPLISGSSSSGNSAGLAHGRRRERGGHRIEQLDRVLVLWILQNVFGRALLDDLPFVEHQNLVGDHPGPQQVMSDIQQTQASISA